MYLDFFGFQEAPFSIAPDPQFLYMSHRHQEALAHLMYGVREAGGFVLLTGEVGTGKTTVCRCLLEQLPEQTDIAFILSPRLSSVELLATICDEFGIAVAESNRAKPYLDALYRFLLQNHSQGRKAVVIIDEAQNLTISVLEQLRLLTNLETNERKLLQIVLLGQPQLRDLLSHPDLEQLAQRITARYHLEPLGRNEVAAYVAHRLQVAGGDRSIIPSAVVRRLYSLSGGIPRVINILCDRALMGAFARDCRTVSKGMVREAAKEVFGRSRGQRLGRWVTFFSVSTVAIILGVVLARSFYRPVEAPPVAVAEPQTQEIVQEPQREVPAPEVAVKEPLKEDPLPWGSGGPDQGMRDAYGHLFSLWGYDLSSKGFICRQAEDQGGQCLHRSGSLGSLRRYNRPAVLQLIGPRGERLFGTLLSLSDSHAVLFAGGKTYRVPLATLSKGWSGKFTLVWRPPEGYRPGVGIPKQPQIVRWAADRLGLIEGQGGQPNAEGALGRELQSFQAKRGLVADGLLGPQTLVRLNELGGAPVPVLVR